MQLSCDSLLFLWFLINAFCCLLWLFVQSLADWRLSCVLAILLFVKSDLLGRKCPLLLMLSHLSNRLRSTFAVVQLLVRWSFIGFACA